MFICGYCFNLSLFITKVHRKPPINWPRRLKRHVLTRWYRAPETLLLQETQETLCALDIWSVGAIFAELLQMQRENRPDPCKRGPIFSGDPCFHMEWIKCKTYLM